ncbi:cyanophycin synthetase family protein, partial [Algoriella sp.]|uniref:cyanophycin synthetase family protein n=1 Tax=Algoriella sp. TaxID=1872434 RepID=UPI001B20E754
MKIENISILRGPNLWSIRREKLIQMRLDLEDLENFPTHKIDGFAERLERFIPSLYEHRCSEGIAGGFFSRLKEGTWMGHVIEHIALEIQNLAGMDTGFGRTRETKTSGVYNVVFNYEEEHVGVYAAKAAVRIAEALIINNEAYKLEEDLQAMREIRQKYSLGPSTRSIVIEAEKRGIPWFRLNNSSFIQFGYGINQVQIEATITAKTSHIAVEIAGDKYRTKQILKSAFVLVAAGGICDNEEDLIDLIYEINYPIVIKPLDGNHGKGVSVNIENLEDAQKALAYAQLFSKEVIVEKFVEG